MFGYRTGYPSKIQKFKQFFENFGKEIEILKYWTSTIIEIRNLWDRFLREIKILTRILEFWNIQEDNKIVRFIKSRPNYDRRTRNGQWSAKRKIYIYKHIIRVYFLEWLVSVQADGKRDARLRRSGSYFCGSEVTRTPTHAINTNRLAIDRD